MPSTLIATKLSVPKGRPNVVPRPRLQVALNANDGRRLTLISAPAGFGKTTLLTAWLQENTETAVAWLSLDTADSDLARFLTYMVGALKSVDATLGDGILDALSAQQTLDAEALVGLLINDTAILTSDVIFVLDDYHLIDGGAVHSAVTFFLEHLPENAKVVIASRSDPPLPLARLRARGQLAELGAADLRFTLEEASAFLNTIMGLSLSPSDVATLEKITEGWVAALQLAALGMQDQADVSSFVQAFSGTNRHILDFLVEEVLFQQPEPVRSFLLHTSVLGRLCAPLCSTLINCDDAQGMLERLEQGNLFVIPLDDERRWYRYHHLFAEVLRVCLTREYPDIVGELHLRASSWFEALGLRSEAVEHALAAAASGADPTFDRAAHILEKEARNTLSSGEGATVLAWLEALPEEAKSRRPRLILEHAATLTLNGQPNAAELLLDETEQLAEATMTDRRYLLGFAAATRCYIARLRGDVQQAVTLGEQALSLLPDEQSPHRAYAAICLGESLRVTGELRAASEQFTEAVKLAQSTRHIYGTLTATVWGVRVMLDQARLREAEGALGCAQKALTEMGAESVPATGVVHFGLGALLYEQNLIEAAERELTKGIVLTERTGEVISLTWGYLTLSRLRWMQGKYEGALELAHQAEQLAQGAGATFEVALVTAWIARLHLTSGNLESAKVLEQTFNADDTFITEAWSHGAQVLVRLYRHKGDYARALHLLEKQRSVAEASGRTGSLIEALILQALTFWSVNRREQALSIITRALTLAEPENFVRTFVDEGAEMRELLLKVLEARQRSRSGLANQVSTRFLAKLLAAFGEAEVEPTVEEQRIGNVTERELEVLALIAAGKSNKAIAATLSVSGSTVKTHINNLYGKLEVRSRTQALARAREIKIL